MKRLLIFVCLAGLAGAQSISNRSARADFGTMRAAGTTNSFQIFALTPSKHTLQAVVTGSPASCSIQLEGSLDGSNWFNLSGSQSCTSSTLFTVVERPVDFVRINLTALSGGTSPAVKVLYVGVF